MKNYMEKKIQELGKYADNREVAKFDFENEMYCGDYHISVRKNRVLVFSNNYQIASFSRGNAKIESNDKINFLLWNVGQIITCPQATAGCKKFCYADKSNNRIGNWKARKSAFGRVKNTIFSTFINFDEIFINVIKALQVKEPDKQVVVRIHESGDLYSISYWNKLKNVVEACPSVKFLIYTKSLNIVKGDYRAFNLPNLVVRLSTDSTTPLEYLEEVNSNPYLTTKVVDKIMYPILDKKVVCGTDKEMAKCANCMKCWNKGIKNIIFLKH